MLLDNDEVEARLSSPLNLMNRLRSETKSKDLSIFGLPAAVPGKVQSPVLPPSADDLVDDLQSKIKLGAIHESALDLLASTLTELKGKLDSVKPEKLSTVAAEMNRIVNSEFERRKQNSNVNNGIQVIFYQPSLRQESEFGLVTVNE